MFNNYKKIKELQMKIKEWITFLDDEIKESDTHLEDLPSDIDCIKELEKMIGNNKDLSRSYDLGRRDALEQIKKLLKNKK